MMRRTIKRSRRKDQKGSALLISLMVMVGLSLLGLGFVAISETESAIAVNERNYVQAQAAAETGCKSVIEMFQDASWAYAEGILPKNLPAFKIKRIYKDAGSSYQQDYYKSGPGDLLFDFPFRGVRGNRFFGDVDSPDVLITYDGGQGTTYLNTLNSHLFYNAGSETDATRISEIRVYAPPWPGAQKLYSTTGATTPQSGAAHADTTNGGWWDASSTQNSRYGIATVRVTAQRVISGKVAAERSVKAIIAETPFPTVDGAIETSGSLVGQGNFNVYWGKILSEKDMQVNRPAVGLPWFDARNFMFFEYGYDSTREWKPATDYQKDQRVHAPDACIALDSDLGKFAFQATSAGTTPVAALAPTCAQWSAAKSLGSSISDSVISWTAIESRQFRYDTNIVDVTEQFYKTNSWLYQLLGRSFEDPWLHARARNTLVYDNSKVVPCGDAVNPHPCDYNDTAQPVTSRYSNFFQNQFKTDPGSYPERVEAVFPTMDYEFWKSIAQSSSNQPGTSIYYFKYTGDGKTNTFQGPGGAEKDITEWLNAADNGSGDFMNGLGPGFYFFDTVEGKNPQFNKGGTLTPDIDINAKVGAPFQMAGYIYLNAKNFGSTGQGSIVSDDVWPMPGEPYRDVGYREVNHGGPNKGKFMLIPNPDTATLPTANYSVAGANNGQFDYDDYNNNGQLDIYVADITKGGTIQRPRPDGTGNLPSPTYAPVLWFDGCEPPDPTAATPVTGNCSEPHEPFLNFTYPDVGNPKDGVKVEWYKNDIDDSEAPTYRKPKMRTAANTVNACKADSSNAECTSNAWDQYGARVRFAPLLVGALYNEGGYAGSGNATYYGALLMRGSFNASGTPDVFFDECLAKGCLETQLKMQRVMVTSMQTD